MSKEIIENEIDSEDMEDSDSRLAELLTAISNDPKYAGCVFEAPGIYFVVCNGEIREISDDASSSPKGGWFPDIVTGPTEEESECLAELMDALGFDEDFFRDYLDDCIDFDEEDAEEYFEGNDDEDSLMIFRKLKRKVASGKTPFASMEELVSALMRYELDSDTLYYEWEGEYIEFYDNIRGCGVRRGYYDSLSDGDWIEILENIDEHIVKA